MGINLSKKDNRLDGFTNSPSGTSGDANAPEPSKNLERNTEDDENKFSEFVNTIFDATTYTIIFWLLVVYGFYGLGKSIYVSKGSINESSGLARYSRIIDTIILFLLGSLLFSAYYRLEEEDKKNTVGYTIQWTHDYFDNPWSIFELIWFTIIFFALVYVLKVPMAPDVKPLLVYFVEKKIWIVFAMFAVIFFFKYVLNIPILDLLFDNSVMNYFKEVPPYSYSDTEGDSPSAFDEITNSINLTDDIYENKPITEVKDEIKNARGENEVFNVSNNVYSYEEAQEVCTAFDASLATYDQIEHSYKNGGEWCNYGWSAGQMAFFPTQKKTWETLQKSEGTKHACGRPGINGGFIDNPYVRFGANCYGKKPKRPDDWGPINYTTDCGIEKEDPNQKIRDEAKLNSFNQTNWSRY